MSAPWVFDDGGRADAGFKGATDDCVCRAVAIVTRKPYAEVYAAINEAARVERPGARRRKGRRSSARTGVFKPTTKRLLESLGLVWTPTMSIGSGCKVHLRADELPSGRLVVAVSKHIVAVVDGVVHDTHDSTRDGTRCVYGYWHQPDSSREAARLRGVQAISAAKEDRALDAILVMALRGTRVCTNPQCSEDFESTKPADFCPACAEKHQRLWSELRAMSALVPLERERRMKP